MNTCGGCDVEFGGLATAHRRKCHNTFASVNAFDRHRRYGKCLKPESIGMEPNAHGYLRIPREDEDDGA